MKYILVEDDIDPRGIIDIKLLNMISDELVVVLDYEGITFKGILKEITNESN